MKSVEDGPQPKLRTSDLPPVSRFLHDNQVIRRDATEPRVELVNAFAKGIDDLEQQGLVTVNPLLSRCPSIVLRGERLFLLDTCFESEPFDEDDEFYLKTTGGTPRKFGPDFVEGAGKHMLGLVAELLRSTGVLKFLMSYPFVWPGHEPVVQFDYYAERNKKMQGLHRDTRGRTVFVFLVFIGKIKFAGTEIVRYARRGQLWGERGIHKLPLRLAQAIQSCMPRSRLPLQRLEAQAAVSQGDVLGFVDPLVFHRTPGLDIVHSAYTQKSGPIVETRFDIERFEGDLNTDAKRAFVRIWVTFEPTNKINTQGVLASTLRLHG